MTECQRGIKSRRQCYPQWPNFPCWVQNDYACYNTAGDTQLFDPLADILRSTAAIVNYIHSAIMTAITGMENQHQQIEARDHYFEFLNDYATTLIPIQNPTLRNLDLVRYYNSDEYLQKAEEAVERLRNGIRSLREGHNMNEAINELAPPPPALQRVPSEELSGGKKRRKTIRRKKRRKTHKRKKK